MIETSIAQHRVLIVGGSGGVGKTSVSAALGLTAARAGHRTLVLTIDPARRLAAALGIDGIGPEAEDVTSRLREAGYPVSGELHAMMLDVRRTLDRAVERHAPTPERREQILANRLYQNIAGKLSGSQEYAAMQQLAEIAASGDYDRIILDTPPTTQALDFLTAPERLQAFFDSNLIRIFLSFGSRAGRGFFRMTDVLFRALERLTGAQVIRDIAEFFEVAESILEPFNRQAARARDLLRDRSTAFVIVTGPDPQQLTDAERFWKALGPMGIAVAHFVVNRRLPALHEPGDRPRQAAIRGELARRVAHWDTALEDLARRQNQAIAALTDAGAPGLIRLPELPGTIHSLNGLSEMSDRLSSNAEPSA
ncbi:MAG: ArsA-related P-loop ATPase [Wenzhouxiangella sp.]|jgi:anion-transporting  ArsA/GET3 family ATPase|nr:ArsA-related P-loop ATPase [Wenzhouxiangella sp.]